MLALRPAIQTTQRAFRNPSTQQTPRRVCNSNYSSYQKPTSYISLTNEQSGHSVRTTSQPKGESNAPIFAFSSLPKTLDISEHSAQSECQKKFMNKFVVLSLQNPVLNSNNIMVLLRIPFFRK